MSQPYGFKARIWRVLHGIEAELLVEAVRPLDGDRVTGNAIQR